MEEEPPFLRGHTKQSMDMSPVKIVKVQACVPLRFLLPGWKWDSSQMLLLVSVSCRTRTARCLRRP